MKIRIIVVLVFIQTFSSSINAQQVWTLEACISHAMENNLEVKKRVLQSEVAKSNKAQSLYNFLPGLEAAMDLSIQNGLSYNYYSSQYEDMDNTSSNINIRGGVTLFNGLQRFNERGQRGYEYQQARYETEGFRHDLSLEIVRQYMQILYESELLEVMKEQLRTDETLMEAIQQKLELGTKSKGEYLEIKAQHARSKASLVETQNRLELSILSLAQLLELEDPKIFKISPPDSLLLVQKPLATEESLFEKAFEVYPALKAKEMGLKASEKNLKREFGKFSPTLSLYGGLYSRFSDLAVSRTIMPGSTYPDFNFRSQLDENLTKDFGVSLSIPIFSRMQNHTGVRVARLDVKMAKIAVEQSRMDLTRLLRQALADANALFENYEALNFSAQASQEAFKQSQQKLELGMISASEYGLAKTNTLKANADKINAKYNFILKAKIIDFYQGVPITF